MARTSRCAEYFRLLVVTSFLMMLAKGQDNERLAISCPRDESENTGDSSQKTATWSAPATTGGVGVTETVCNPPTGSMFNIGVHDVTCEARDAAGNTATCTFRVTIIDNQDPSYENCPSRPIRSTVQMTDGQLPGLTANVTWGTPAFQDNSGEVDLAFTHKMDSQFPLGVTTVTYTGRDMAGRSSSCSFKVYGVVQPPNTIYIKGITSTSFTVVWPELESKGGAAVDYSIYVWKEGEQKPPSNEREFVESAEEADATYTYNQHQISGRTSPGELYRVQVESESEEMISSVQTWSKPSPPVNLMLSSLTSSSVELSWTPSASNVEQYWVTLSDGRDLGYLTKTTNRTVVDSLPPGSGYFAYVRAVVGSGDMRLHSDSISAGFTVLSPSASELVAFEYTESTIQVAWSASSDTGNQYEPYMLFIEPPHADKSFQTVFHPDNTALFKGLEPNTQYQIRLISNLGLSLETTQTTRPGRVSNVRPTEVLDESIKLEWDPPKEEDVDSYEIYRSPSDEAVNPITVLGPEPMTSHVFSSLTNGTEYFFKIVSVKDGAKSVPQTLMVTAGVTDAAVLAPLNVVAIAVGVALGLLVLILAIILLVTCLKYRNLKGTGGDARRNTASSGHTNKATPVEEEDPAQIRSIDRTIDDGDTYEVPGAPQTGGEEPPTTNPTHAYQNSVIGQLGPERPKVKAKPNLGRR